MREKIAITVARGDGIGPEIMDACLRVLEAAGADLAVEHVEVGEAVYLRGNASGVGPGAFDSIRRTRVFYKAPLTTPQGGGFKSVNVTTRKTFGLYANVRPCRSLQPFVATRHPKMDLVIIRENEEDLYAGIEHQQTDEVVQCLKLFSRTGTEKICRFAFEYARHQGRRKVTCFTKDNIMKLTDGLFHRIFEEVGAEYPDITKEHWIVDIGMAKVVDTPEMFDVVLVPNLYGDILSDITGQMMGSVGLAGSANIGEHASMFEAIHGSAPRRAGQDAANPSGLLLAGVMMLEHIGRHAEAEAVHNAWLRTLEDGVHTYDVAREGMTKAQVGTRAFADAIIDRLGKRPEKLPAARHERRAPFTLPSPRPRPAAKRELVGVDVFVCWDEAGRSPEALARRLQVANGEDLHLTMLTNRGQKVWPQGAPETTCTDHWRCRFTSESGARVTQDRVLAVTRALAEAGLEVIKTEHLYTIDGKPGFSAGQGQ